MAGTLPSGYQFHADRDYLLPIPPSELELNKKLKQKPEMVIINNDIIG